MHSNKQQTGASLTRLAAIAALSAAITLAAGEAWAERPDDLLVIGNRSIRVTRVTPAQLRQLFLRKRNSLGGDRVVPVNAKAGTRSRKAFRQRVLKMTPTEELRYWQERRIRSGVTKPAEFRNVLKAVFKVRGAIGYIPRAMLRPGVVKVLYVLPAPTES